MCLTVSRRIVLSPLSFFFSCATVCVCGTERVLLDAPASMNLRSLY